MLSVQGVMLKLNLEFDVLPLLNDQTLWSSGNVLHILNQYYRPPVGSEYFLYRFPCHVLKTNNCANNIHLQQGRLRRPVGNLPCLGNQRRMIFISVITTTYRKFPRGWTSSARLQYISISTLSIYVVLGRRRYSTYNIITVTDQKLQRRIFKSNKAATFYLQNFSYFLEKTLHFVNN